MSTTRSLREYAVPVARVLAQNLASADGPLVNFETLPPSEFESSRWFAQEVQSHETVLRSYLRGSFPTVRDVDDVVQESYLRVWKARASQPIRCVRGFLFQVARRLALDTVRREKVSPIDVGSDLAALSVYHDGPDAATAAIQADLKRHLVDAVAALPKRYREIVVMRKFEDIPQSVVAQELGLSVRTVENLLARGLKKVEATLRARGVLEQYL